MADWLTLDGYRFVNDEHRDTYIGAKRLLDAELRRESEDAERLGSEWVYLPDHERKRRERDLLAHFAKCRQPYFDLLADVLAIAMPSIVINKPVAE